MGGHAPRGAAYAIRRRPVPSANAREIALPTGVVIDATTWQGTQERSRLPVNAMSGYVDIIINPDGTMAPSIPYGVPTALSAGMGTPCQFDPNTGNPLPYTGIPACLNIPSSYFHFWLADRKDVCVPSGAIGATGPSLPIAAGSANPAPDPVLSRPLQGNYGLVTVTARTGQIAASEGMPFDFAGAWTASYNPGLPFVRAQQRGY
jgi:hypothetical protein